MLNYRPLATVRSYSQLIAVLRARSDEMKVTREIADASGKMSSGYSGKLLSQTPTRHLGGSSLGAVLGVLGLALVVVEDQIAKPQAGHNRVKRKST